MMKFRNPVAASIALFLLFLFTVPGFCAGDGTVSMEQWLKIINPQETKKSPPPKTTEIKNDSESTRPSGGQSIVVTLYWHMADDADVYLNGKPLRRYEPSFKTRPDEAPQPAFAASATLREGDVFTVGGRRGGSFGFMLIAVDAAGRVVFQTNGQSWKAYEPGDRPDWFNPQVALASSAKPVTVQPDPWYPQKELNAKYGNKALSIWNTPADTFAYLYGIVGGGIAAERSRMPDNRPMTGISQQQLIDTVKIFRMAAVAEPVAALKKYSSGSALRDLTGIENSLFTGTPPEVGWKYYFATAAYTVVPFTEQARIVLFYQPWSDTAVMTLWQQGTGQLTMTRAELVLGDYIRQYGLPPFEVQPLWELKAKTFTPFLAVPLAVGETLTAFANIFPAGGEMKDGSPFAEQRRNFDKNLKNKEIHQGILAAASLRFERTINTLVRYEQDNKLEVYRDLTSLILAGIRRGDFNDLKVTIPQTSPETLELIAANHEELGLFKVVSLLKTPNDCFVFLSHPADPNNVFALWFQTDKGQYGLRQAYFMNHSFSASYVSELIAKVNQP